MKILAFCTENIYYIGSWFKMHQNDYVIIKWSLLIFEFFSSDIYIIGGETFQDLQDQYEEPIQFEAKKIDPEDEEEEEELEDAK